MSVSDQKLNCSPELSEMLRDRGITTTSLAELRSLLVNLVGEVTVLKHFPGKVLGIDKYGEMESETESDLLARMFIRAYIPEYSTPAPDPEPLLVNLNELRNTLRDDNETDKKLMEAIDMVISYERRKKNN